MSDLTVLLKLLSLPVTNLVFLNPRFLSLPSVLFAVMFRQVMFVNLPNRYHIVHAVVRVLSPLSLFFRIWWKFHYQLLKPLRSGWTIHSLYLMSASGLLMHHMEKSSKALWEYQINHTQKPTVCAAQRANENFQDVSHCQEIITIKFTFFFVVTWGNIAMYHIKVRYYPNVLLVICEEHQWAQQMYRGEVLNCTQTCGRQI